MLDCLQGHWNIRKRFEPEAGQGLPFLLEMLVNDENLAAVHVETLIFEQRQRIHVDAEVQVPNNSRGRS